MSFLFSVMENGSKINPSLYIDSELVVKKYEKNAPLNQSESLQNSSKEKELEEHDARHKKLLECNADILELIKKNQEKLNNDKSHLSVKEFDIQQQMLDSLKNIALSDRKNLEHDLKEKRKAIIKK